MNKNQKEMLEQAEYIKTENLREMEFDSIYILPQNKKHDSGYKMMYVIGNLDNKCYLIATYSDVIDFNYFNPIAVDLHIDIKENGIIHLWSNSFNFKVLFNTSSCIFKFIEKEK